VIRIQALAFKDPAKQLLVKANTEIRPDIKDALGRALEVESGDGKKAIEALLENQKIACNKKIPLCQDTGYISFFLKKGPNICIEGDLQKILNEAAAEIYNEMPFRLSMVDDPIERTPSKTNTPVFFYQEQTMENKAILEVIVKGAGSDNSSALMMFLGSTPKDEISSWIYSRIIENGPKACPPLVIGIGIGGGFERSALLSKKAFFRKIGERNPKKLYADWERELLLGVNKLGIGPSAFGGKTTALDVFIEQSPVHMASMPVALNICCYALRTASMEVGV
jgi:fumarate hydratase subunit alpha